MSEKSEEYFKQKYFKYKQKYLELKNGGSGKKHKSIYKKHKSKKVDTFNNNLRLKQHQINETIKNRKNLSKSSSKTSSKSSTSPKYK